jgi:hypothetical protein
MRVIHRREQVRRTPPAAGPIRAGSTPPLIDPSTEPARFRIMRPPGNGRPVAATIGLRAGR